MKIILIFLFITISSIANKALSQNIEIPGTYHWKNRILLVFAPTGEPQMKQQMSHFQEQHMGMEDRDLVVFRIMKDKVTDPEGNDFSAEAANKLRSQYNVDTSEFTVILIGKDGTEKLRQHDLLKTEKLFAIIDAMPMRRREMRENDGY